MSLRSERARRRASNVRNQRIVIIVIAALILAISVFFILRAVTQKPVETASEMITTATGLQYQDVQVGTGQEAKNGDTVSVHYTGWLEDGTKFDSSLDRGQPFEFTLGAGNVIKGWDEGVAGMQTGGVRKLFIPAELGYGQSGAGDVIPPNAKLIFEVELLEVK